MDFRKRAVELIENNKGYARTGCTLLDCAVGGGQGLGFPFGRILNFIGDKSSGKTFLSNEIIANCVHTFLKNLKWNYDDAESGYTFDLASMYDLPLDKEKEPLGKSNYYSRTVEALDVNLSKFLKSVKENQKGVYVVDSLDGLANADILEREEARIKGMDKAEKEGKVYKDDGTYGMQSAAFLSQEFFRTKADKLQHKEALLIFISQIRDKINAGQFERKWKRAGGKALDFFAHTVLVMANVHKIIREGLEMGVVVKVKVDKSKTPRPYRECLLTLYFDYGIDDVGTSLDFLFDLRGKDFKLKSNAESINLNGVEKKLANMKEFLLENELYGLAKKEKKADTGKAALNLDWVDVWLEAEPIRAKKALAYFGETYTRDELLGMADNDPEFKKEIEIRTIAKWEEIEYNARTKRKSKYAKPEKKDKGGKDE